VWSVQSGRADRRRRRAADRCAHPAACGMQCDAHHGDAQRRHCDQHALAAARFGTKDSAIAFPLAPHPPVSASADRCADRRALRPIRRAPMGYGVSNDAELLRVDSLLGKRRFGGEIELVYVAGESHHSRDACGEATESTAHALLTHSRDVASAMQLGQRLDGFSGPDLSRVPRSTPIAGSPRPSARRLPSTVHHDGLMAYDVD
jgi:hypothetical protein